MDSTTTAPTRPAQLQVVPAALGIAGGLLAIVGAVLSWEQVTLNDTFRQFYTGPTTAAGLDGNGGKICIALGLIAIALAGAAFVNVRIPAAAPSLIAVGALIVIVALLNYGRMQDDISQFNDALDILKGGAVSTDGLSIGIGIGLWLDIAAGVVVAVAGVLPFVLKRR